MSMKMTMAEFVGLELCPFCKGEAFYNPGYNGGNVKCRECGAEGAYKPTEAEAIAAWNTRVDYHGYEQAAIESWESIKAWNSRAERTCEFSIKDNMNETEGMGDVWFRCTNCGTTYDYYADDWLMKQNYCPNCGFKIRKVVNS